MTAAVMILAGLVAVAGAVAVGSILAVTVGWVLDRRRDERVLAAREEVLRRPVLAEPRGRAWKS